MPHIENTFDALASHSFMLAICVLRACVLVVFAPHTCLFVCKQYLANEKFKFLLEHKVDSSIATVKHTHTNDARRQPMKQRTHSTRATSIIPIVTVCVCVCAVAVVCAMLLIV